MVFFSDAHGQVTHKSLVKSCQISNPFEILWGFLMPARLKKIQSKMKALAGHNTIHCFFRRSRVVNCEVSNGILPKIKVIQAFMAGLVTCRNEEDPSKNECTTTFLPL